MWGAAGRRQLSWVRGPALLGVFRGAGAFGAQGGRMTADLYIVMGGVVAVLVAVWLYR